MGDPATSAAGRAWSSVGGLARAAAGAGDNRVVGARAAAGVGDSRVVGAGDSRVVEARAGDLGVGVGACELLASSSSQP